jgi:hypothetical protein
VHWSTTTSTSSSSDASWSFTCPSWRRFKLFVTTSVWFQDQSCRTCSWVGFLIPATLTCFVLKESWRIWTSFSNNRQRTASYTIARGLMARRITRKNVRQVCCQPHVPDF